VFILSKKNILFFSIIVLPLSLYTQVVTVPNGTPFNIAPTYNYNPTINSEYNPHITTQLDSHITVDNTSTLSVKISEISMQCIQKIKETMTRDNYHLLKDFITQTLWQYRYTIACGTLMGSYSIISILLLTDYYHYLQNKTLWARWKPECSFECLCTMPQKKLTQELLTTINERYYNKNNPTDFAHPLTMFIITIDGEIKTCKRYISTAQTIKRLHLTAIFPTNDNKLDEVNKLLERALFIKHIFLSWLSDYNIASSKKTS
jgi:hypothetical protein